MEPLDLYREFARRFGREQFLTRYAGLFLVKRPTATRALPTSDPPASLDYRTTEVNLGSSAALNLDVFAAEWRVAPLQKRQGNPFPDRIGIGRAPNCDVVVRLPFLSKLHAHFHLEQHVGAGPATATGNADAAIRLVDLKSSNGTTVNGTALAPNVPQVVSLGDELRFGALETTLVDAPQLYALLLGEARSG